MVPIEEEGGLSKTHHQMHDGIILSQTDVRTRTEDKPVLGVALSETIGSPAGWGKFVWIGVDGFIVERVP